MTEREQIAEAVRLLSEAVALLQQVVAPLQRIADGPDKAE